MKGIVEVYYDGACPSCIRDRRRYTKMAGARASEVKWFDITGREDELRRMGIDPERALKELHVRDEKGKIHSALDAYILLMQRVSHLKPLAWLISLPLVRPLLTRLYHHLVSKRLHRSGRL